MSVMRVTIIPTSLLSLLSALHILRSSIHATQDEECNVGHPYAKRNRRDDPILVPNGDVRGLNELLEEVKGKTGHTHVARLKAKW